MEGKKIRLQRLFRDNGKMVMIPMDHGMTMGPIKGIAHINQAVSSVGEGGVDAVVLHKGMANVMSVLPRSTSLIVHVSASTTIGPDSSRKVIVCSVEEAVRMGATAVSTHINIGSASEAEQLKDNADIARECAAWGMPLLMMAYPRGVGINEFDPEAVAHAVRVAAELGADIVKTNYTGSVESFREVVANSPVPILIAGGGKSDDDLDLFTTVEGALEAGAAGISIGRNVFGHDAPGLISRQLVRMVHEGISAEEAYASLPHALNLNR